MISILQIINSLFPRSSCGPNNVFDVSLIQNDLTFMLMPVWSTYLGFQSVDWNDAFIYIWSNGFYAISVCCSRVIIFLLLSCISIFLSLLCSWGQGWGDFMLNSY